MPLSDPPDLSQSPSQNIPQPSPTDNNMRITGLPSNVRVEFHPNIPASRRGGRNLLQEMDADVNLKEIRRTHLFYPFANKAEWELASWLCNGGLSQRDIDSFLKLDFVSFEALSRPITHCPQGKIRCPIIQICPYTTKMGGVPASHSSLEVSRNYHSRISNKNTNVSLLV